MQNLLTDMVEKISEIEKHGIYIEEIQFEDRYNFDDEKRVSLTGNPRPAGEYYIAHLTVMVSTAPQKTISTIDDVFNAATAAIKQMPRLPMNETKTVIATTDIGTIVRRDPGHNKATKSEYMEEYCPKKSVKKAVNNAK